MEEQAVCFQKWGLTLVESEDTLVESDEATNSNNYELLDTPEAPLNSIDEGEFLMLTFL